MRYLILFRDITTWLFKTYGGDSGRAVLAWFFFGLPLIVIPVYTDGANRLGWRRERSLVHFATGFIGGAVMSITLNISSLRLDIVHDVPYGFILQLLIFSFFVAALQEETLFRGYVQPRLEEKYGRLRGLLLTSILFGLAHIGFLTIWGSLLAVILGIVMGYLRDRTGTLLAPWGFHGTLNFMGHMFILLYGGVYTII